MARRRYFRRYVRVAPKKKWASNILYGTVTTSNYATVCENSSQTSTPTPVIVKCGNFKVQGDCMYQVAGSSNPRPVNMNFFLLFVPEGVTPGDALIGAHPEWIIGWKKVDVGAITNVTETQTATSTFSLTTRLKRNLNSGDRIVAILQSGDSAMGGQCVFTCQFWTCAN